MKTQDTLETENIEKETYTKEEVELIKAEMNDKYLRVYAEFDNYKKRSKKDIENAILSTKTSMLTSILDIDNDISISLKQIKDIEDMKGIQLIISKLSKFLSDKGIESIQTDIYDKDLHEVISIVKIGENKILDVISKGYTINGKPFRYPKIILGE